MNTATMNLVIAINKSYVPYAYVLLFSLLTNNPVPVCVYVLHRELTGADKALIQQLSGSFPVSFQFIYIPDELLPPPEVLAASNWGIEAYFRLAITDLLPESVDRALYLDTDIIVHGSIEELYRIDFAGKKIAACEEFFGKPPYHSYRDELFAPFFSEGFCYFNSGMILYNMDAVRKEHSFHTYMETARSLNYAIEYPDQDLLNYCHFRETLYVDTFKYNLNARYGYVYYQLDYARLRQDGVIVHYASSKPWRGNFLHCDVEWLWWDYATQTPLSRQLLEEALRDNVKDPAVNLYIADLAQKNSRLYQKLDYYESLLEKSGIKLD